MKIIFTIFFILLASNIYSQNIQIYKQERIHTIFTDCSTILKVNSSQVNEDYTPTNKYIFISGTNDIQNIFNKHNNSLPFEVKKKKKLYYYTVFLNDSILPGELIKISMEFSRRNTNNCICCFKNYCRFKVKHYPSIETDLSEKIIIPNNFDITRSRPRHNEIINGENNKILIFNFHVKKRKPIRYKIFLKKP